MGSCPLFQKRPFPQLKKYQHVEKMHPAQDEDDRACFETQLLDELTGIGDIEFHPQRIYGIAQVDEVKTHQQEIVHGLRQLLVAVKNIDQKDAAVTKEGSGYPDGEDNGDQEVETVEGENVRHKTKFWVMEYGLDFLF
jgi:hypothetical protein